MPAAAILVGVLAVVGAGLSAATLTRERPQATDAVVVSTIQTAPVTPATPLAAAPATVAALDSSLFAPTLVTAPPPPGSTVEIQNGVKIVRLNPAASSASVTMPVGSALPTPLARAPDPRVSERSPDGTLPRIGKDGSRPSNVYARPAQASEVPKVALVVLGAGRDQLGSAEAARRLPGEIDFALPPDTPDGATQVAEMRRGGREVVLDLGAGIAPGSLLKAMATWSGYVGLRVPAGADDAMLQARDRGLVVTGPVGSESGVNVVTDAADPVALAAALNRLAAIARAKGAAVGWVENAIAGRDTLAQSVTLLSAQGVALVPLSAVSDLRGATAAR